jgi:hypothetical protein
MFSGEDFSEDSSSCRSEVPPTSDNYLEKRTLAAEERRKTAMADTVWVYDSDEERSFGQENQQDDSSSDSDSEEVDESEENSSNEDISSDEDEELVNVNLIMNLNLPKLLKSLMSILTRTRETVFFGRSSTRFHE